MGIQVAKGQSGMPIWGQYGSPNYIMAIFTYLECGDGLQPCANRLNENKYDRLIYWLTLDTPPIDKPDLTNSGSGYSNPYIVTPAVTWFEVHNTVTNLGTAEAMAPYNVSYYASLDADITTGDYFIGTKLVINSLFSFHNQNISFGGTFPGNIPAGNYYIGWVIDSGGVLAEFDEGNNSGNDWNYLLTVQTPDHNLTGQVKNSQNQGIAGIKMTGLPGTPVTNSSGNYAAMVPHQWAGTVWPTGCYNFSPTHRTYSSVLWNLSNQDFTGFTKDCSTQDDDCKTGYCDPADGACKFNYQPNGTACDDGLFCTVNGECQHGACDSDLRDCLDEWFCNGFEWCDETNNVCAAGTPPQCDDYVACTIDACLEDTDECEHIQDHASCDDSNVCTDDFCVIGVGCASFANHDPCDDGLWCSVNDYCAGSLCLGYPRNCSDGIDCTGDGCVEATQECVHNPRDSVCEDENFCNGVETCDEIQGCLPGANPCPDDGLFCNGTEGCDEWNDECTHTRSPCVTGQGQTCGAGTQSCDEINDQCVSSSDECPDDGLWCNGAELCLPIIGICGHDSDLSGPVCPDNGQFCDGDEYCDEPHDQCLSEGDPCPDDGVFCNGTEVCNGDTGGCDHVNPPTCDDGIPCTEDGCSYDLNDCDHYDYCDQITVSVVGPLTALPSEQFTISVDISDGSGVDAVAFELSYSDLDAANVSYLDYGTGNCLLSEWEDFDCTDNGDSLLCAGTGVDPLEPGSEGCLVEFVFEALPDTWGAIVPFTVSANEPDLLLMTMEGHDLYIRCQDSSDCDDGVYCNGQEWCDDVGECRDGDPVVCEDNGNFCDGQEFCNEELNECDSDGDPCTYDELFCNGEEYCSQELGQCATTGDPCPDDGLYCTGVETCNENDDRCLATGNPCFDDGLYCNGAEWCDEDNDICDHFGDPCTDDGQFCNGVESCDEVDDQCVTSGNPCPDNGVFCDGVEICDPGVEACISSGDPCRDNGLFCDGDEYCNTGADQCASTGDPCDPETQTCNEDDDICAQTGPIYLTVTARMHGAWNGAQHNCTNLVQIDLYNSSGPADSFFDITFDINGTAQVDMVAEGVPPGSYYVVLRHLNHIDLMTAAPVSWDGATAITVDLTNPANVECGESTMYEYSPGVFAMPAGDIVPDHRVALSDFNYLRTHWTETDPACDLDCDGYCRLGDFNKLRQTWNTQGCAP